MNQLNMFCLFGVNSLADRRRLGDETDGGRSGSMSMSMSASSFIGCDRQRGL